MRRLDCPKFITKFSFLVTLVSLMTSPTQGDAQTLFLNNNQSCQDETVSGYFIEFLNIAISASSMDCGDLGGPLAVGGQEAPDCVTQTDPAYNGIFEGFTNDVLFNTGISQNNCLNAGGEAQFESSLELNNESFQVEETEPLRAGTIALGNLDGQFKDDAAWNYPFEIVINDQGIDPLAKSVQYLLGQADGGFAPSFNPVTVHLAPNLPDGQRPFNYPASIYDEVPAIQARGSQQSLLLLNCDQDDLDEGVVGVIRQDPGEEGQTGIMVLENDPNNPGLQEPLFENYYPFNVTALTDVESSNLTLTAADFNQDGNLDVAAALNRLPNLNGPDGVLLCLGDGACGFDCSDFHDLGPNTFPQSITSGDFDGDGDSDLAIAQAGLMGVKYLYNDPETAFSDWNTFEITLSNEGGAPRPLVISSGRFSREAYAKNGAPSTDEVVVASPRFEDPILVQYTLPQTPSTLEIIETDGQGGFKPEPTQLRPMVVDPSGVSGLVAKRFHVCGGDSIVALNNYVFFSEIDEVFIRNFSFFANANEAPEIQLPDNLTIEEGNSITIPAECYDPTHDPSQYQWSVIQAPEGAQFSLLTQSGDLVNGASDATNVFEGDRGDYTLQLDCTDICGLSAAKTVQINFSPDSSDPSGEDTTTDGQEFFPTQGSCLANLNSTGANPGLFFLLVALGFPFLKKRLQG